jgi:type II secretion system protein J
MNIEVRNPKSEIRGRCSHADGSAFRSGHPLAPRTPPLKNRQAGFTLLEVLLALIVLAVVLVAVHSVFLGAVALRNKTDEAFSEAIPLEHTLTVIKRDVANLTALEGAQSGTPNSTLQTAPTKTSTASLAHFGQQCGPTFYSTSGTLNDFDPWSEMRKVTYYLAAATNGLPGFDLIRSVTRNLLPIAQEEYTDQTLMSGVYDLAFEFYKNSSWVKDWDSADSSSSSESNSLPQGVRVQITLINESGIIGQNPIEMVIPVEVQPGTNTTSSAGDGG